MNKKVFFISTAIDYPSEKPHLGHCLEKIQADVIARYKRLQGFDVHFSIGLDEHGLKIQRYAQKANKKPQEFVDGMSKYFKDLWKILNISNDDFIRTTEKRHEKVIQQIVRKIYKKGDIYKGKYKGLYCVDCESYYLPKDLEDGKCPVHHKPPEVVEEETYFFRMSKYQKKLLRHIEKNKDFIVPESKRNEILSRLKKPLQDLSISRKTVEWGIPLPIDEKFSLFVWIDALINYFTTIDYPGKKFKKFWPADVHVIGKDIIWHHSVIWGSLLLSLGLSLPKTIFVHGFIIVGGQKMSKSLGNVVNPFELVKKYGTDTIRYFLIREFSSFEDGNFSEKRIKERYNSDLAQGIGNLLSRILALGDKYHSPIPLKINKLKAIVKEIELTYHQGFSEFRFNEALAKVWDLINILNKFITDNKPWESLENNKSLFLEDLSTLILSLGKVALLLRPVMPETSGKLLEALQLKNLAETDWPKGKIVLKKSPALFPFLS
jgi:methionyl-tRNA synthetase